jgi:hypothetical protein
MKKILFLVLFLLSAQSIYADKKNSFVLKFGITPYSILTQKTEKQLYTQTTNIGATFYLEYFRKINSKIYLGSGFSQQIERNTQNNSDISSSNFYLTSNISVYKNLYSILQFGISNIIFGKDIVDIWKDEKIGPHYGIGVGYLYKNFIFEFLYCSDNAVYKQKYEEFVKYINYQTFNFNIGYKFDFNFPSIKRVSKEPKKTKIKERKKSEKELLIEQNELLKKQIELLEQRVQED